jgi:hypothetical protein
MKKTFFPISFMCLFALFACHKDHATGPATTTDSTTTTTTKPLGTLKINLTVGSVQADTANNNYELIISEPAGSVLLDTIVAPYTVVATTLHTNATLVDLTNIIYNSLNAYYNVITYKAVNPSTWTNSYSSNFYAPLSDAKFSATDTILYTNVPASADWYFAANPAPGYLESSPGNSMQFIYNGTLGYPNYLLFPALGLYRMYTATTTNMTVDCTNMDTAVSTSFNASANYSPYFISLYGMTDSTDPNSYLDLYTYESNLKTQNPPLVYPPKYIQKYWLAAEFAGNNNDYFTAYSFGNKISSTITYPDPNFYSIASTQNNKFSVTFTAAKPSQYSTYWQNASISWTLYSSPDSTTINPIALLTAQKSKLLQNQNLGSMSLASFEYETVPGYDYGGLLSFVCNSSALSNTRIPSGTMYFKLF